MLDFFLNLFKNKNGHKLILSFALYGSLSLIVFVRYGRIFRSILSKIRNYLVAFIDFILVLAYVFGLILSVFSIILLAILIFQVIRKRILNLKLKNMVLNSLVITITNLAILILFLAFFAFVFENELPINLMKIIKSFFL